MVTHNFIQQAVDVYTYMSTQREVFEGQTASFGRGVRGSSPGNLKKTSIANGAI